MLDIVHVHLQSLNEVGVPIAPDPVSSHAYVFIESHHLIHILTLLHSLAGM